MIRIIIYHDIQNYFRGYRLTLFIINICIYLYIYYNTNDYYFRWRNPLRIVPLDITEKTRISYEKLGQFCFFFPQFFHFCFCFVYDSFYYDYFKRFKEMDTKAGNFIWSIIQFYHRRSFFLLSQFPSLLSHLPPKKTFSPDTKLSEKNKKKKEKKK